MRSEKRTPSAFSRLLAFELRRFPTRFRMALTAASLVSMVFLARDALLQELTIATSQMPGAAGEGFTTATAFDMLYLAFNSKVVAGVMLPAVCGMLCADLIVRDRVDGMRTVIAREVPGTGTYIAAKLCTAAIVSFGYVALFSLVCMLVSCLLMGLPISLEPPAWLSSAGPEDSIWGQSGPIPASWNYLLVICVLVAGFGMVETVLSWTMMALCTLLRTPSAAPLLAASCYALAAQVETLATSLGLLLGIESLTTTVGWATDRLCLANYRLGATLFQVAAGGAYQGAAEVVPEVALLPYPINSWASLITVLVILSCASVIWLIAWENGVGPRARNVERSLRAGREQVPHLDSTLDACELRHGT